MNGMDMEKVWCKHSNTKIPPCCCTPVRDSSSYSYLETIFCCFWGSRNKYLVARYLLHSVHIEDLESQLKWQSFVESESCKLSWMTVRGVFGSCDGVSYISTPLHGEVSVVS